MAKPMVLSGESRFAAGLRVVRTLRAKGRTSTFAQGLLVLSDQGFRSMSTFLAAILVGRACGQIEYGFYTLLLTILISAEEFQVALVSTPYVVQSPSKSGKEKHIYLGNAIVIQLLIAGATSLCLFGSLHAFPLPGSASLSGWIIPTFTLAYFSVLLREFLRQVLLADLAVGWNLLFGISVHVSLVLVLITLTFTGWLNDWSAYASLTACSLLPSLMVIWCKRHAMRLQVRGLLGQFLENWRVGRWLAAQATITVVSGPVYTWVLASSHGPATVALLAACILPSSVISPVVQALNAFVLPKASHAAQRGVRYVKRIVVRATVFVALGLGVFPLLLGLFSTPIMTLLFAGKYRPSGWLVMFLALRVYFVVLGVPVSAGLVACKQTYALFKSEVISLILTVLFGLPLTYLLGIWGVAWGFLLTRLLSRAYLALMFRRYLKSSLEVAPAVLSLEVNRSAIAPVASV